MWPDLAKFHLFGKVLILFWQINYAIGQIFIPVNSQILFKSPIHLVTLVPFETEQRKPFNGMRTMNLEQRSFKTHSNLFLSEAKYLLKRLVSFNVSRCSFGRILEGLENFFKATLIAFYCGHFCETFCKNLKTFWHILLFWCHKQIWALWLVVASHNNLKSLFKGPLEQWLASPTFANII